MSNHIETLVPIDGLSRRDILRNIALAVTAVAGGELKLEAAQHVHQHAAEEKKKTGSYTSKLFNEHEFKTLGRLAELIVPADGVSGSARDAGAPEFIDLLCSQNQQLADIFTGGLGWLDAEMRQRHSANFVDAREEQQTATLDLLVEFERQQRERKTNGLTYEETSHYKGFEDYGFLSSTDLGPGIVFFDWVRKMTVDAFYTSEIGVKDLGYKGNGALPKFEVPQEVIDYAIKHSPFGKM